MDWKKEKDGLTVVASKDNLTVVWDCIERKYEVRRSEGDTEKVVEKGTFQRMDSRVFLHYVEVAWGNNSANAKNE
ncbi:MAG: hypothetical protein K2O66_03745 [Bacteroidales bacterium]|nr:hypothetical protein [Bacteroidales bacterium]MDE7072464.1 hypothetical protein [Bacteroidales bacterium]